MDFMTMKLIMFCGEVNISWVLRSQPLPEHCRHMASTYVDFFVYAIPHIMNLYHLYGSFPQGLANVSLLWLR